MSGSLFPGASGHGRIDKRQAAVKAISPATVALLSAHSALKVRREWIEKTAPENQHEHTRYFILGVGAEQGKRLGRAVREHWSADYKNYHKRDHHVWQEDRHRHRRTNIAQNLALTRNALLAIIPFDDKNNHPNEIRTHSDNPYITPGLCR
jgi:predicted transposase YbfD/YdcC